MRAGIGAGVEKFGQIWARLDNGGQVWFGHTDQVGMGDMGSGYMGGSGYMCRSRGGCGQVWADMGKGLQWWAGLDGSD